MLWRAFHRSPPVVFLCLLTFAACERGGIEIVDPRQDSGGEPGDLRPGELRLVFVADSSNEAAALPAALGWLDGRVPATTAGAVRENSWFHPDTMVADSVGIAKFLDRLPGVHMAWGRRLLTDAERTVLGDIQVYAVGGGLKTQLRGWPVEVPLVLDEPGSLVISEWAHKHPRQPGVGTYLFGGYLELYNNADTTVYLDGKLIGTSYFVTRDFETRPCEATAPLREDPGGLYARWFHAFPGTGTEYPLDPGDLVVVAIDAIDHSQIVDGMLDLSDADFEFAGTGDVDNPDVPNMPEVGLAPWFFGHGLTFSSGDPVFLSEPVNLAAQPVRRDPLTGVEFVRIPTDRVLDVMVVGSPFAFPVPPCARKLPAALEQLDGIYTDPGQAAFDQAVHRRIAGIRPDGRLVLLRTRTSAADFFTAPRSPGRISVTRERVDGVVGVAY